MFLSNSGPLPKILLVIVCLYSKIIFHFSYLPVVILSMDKYEKIYYFFVLYFSPEVAVLKVGEFQKSK